MNMNILLGLLREHVIKVKNVLNLYQETTELTEVQVQNPLH